MTQDNTCQAHVTLAELSSGFADGRAELGETATGKCGTGGSITVPEPVVSCRPQSPRTSGGFCGPDHAEAAEIFEQSSIVGAFGASR